jgi:hypothetical protein
MPLSSATMYAGYRYQGYGTETEFDVEEQGVTKGFAVGVNVSF